VRRLLPPATDAEPVDLAEAYALPADHPAGRPFVRSDFVVAVDGAVTLEGRSQGLGGPADRAVFRALRGFADVVLVGAGTVRAEGYGPVRLDDETQAARRGRGQPPIPPVAVVTNTLQLDWRSPLFTEASTPTIVICGGASDERRRRDAAETAEVITAGDGAQADLAVAMAVLADRGMLHVLTEGGPTLHGELARAGLLDELCVTISPMLAGSGAGTTHLLGPHGLPQPARLRLTNLLEADDGYLFARYRF
jgi:riboflavin biosynthesis pyrimidine reductase